jgi:hypothetical protein
MRTNVVTAYKKGTTVNKAIRRSQKPKKASSKPKPETRYSLPRGSAAFLEKSTAFQEKLTRVANAVSKMRSEKISLAAASKEFHVAPATVAAWGKSGLSRASNGRFIARKTDRIPRQMVILTADGKRQIVVLDSRQATTVGEHWNAVGKYVRTGEAEELAVLRDKSVVDADGVKHALLTDTAELNRQAGAGTLSFESIYGRAA